MFESLLPANLGSSPLARGARVALLTLGDGEGIIPACAGSTTSTSPTAFSRRDHPRLRGEHCVPVFVCGILWGSSPLARGALGRVWAHRPVLGIIPACAGSTPASPSRPEGFRDHPRLRGEHTAGASSSTARRGSSPLARGAPSVDVLVDEALGIIPACAGSTAHQRARNPRRQDHPRLRGEHTGFRAANSMRVGSSPLARGARKLRIS